MRLHSRHAPRYDVWPPFKMASIRQESTVIVFTFRRIGWNRNEINGHLTYFVTYSWWTILFYDEYSEFKEEKKKKRKKKKKYICTYISLKFSWIWKKNNIFNIFYRLQNRHFINELLSKILYYSSEMKYFFGLIPQSCINVSQLNKFE